MERSMPLTEALYYILLVLGEPLHGYGIIQTVSAITGERVLLGPGTLYGALNTLLERDGSSWCGRIRRPGRRRNTSAQRKAARPCWRRWSAWRLWWRMGSGY